MCGIVGAIAQRDVCPILEEGLRRLEYRGYDSAGIAVLNEQGALGRQRAVGKVSVLSAAIEQNPLPGSMGVAHTRWATHGEPSEANAHPHISKGDVALVHNGIIENHDALREELKAAGYDFASATDTEVIVHLVHQELSGGLDLLDAVRATVKRLDGAYALAVMHKGDPDRIIAARSGSPLVLGIGIGEHFVASDVSALLPVTQRFVFLEEGDSVDMRRDGYVIYDQNQTPVERPIKESSLSADATSKGEFRHYMLKETYEQPAAISETLEGRLVSGRLLTNAFGPEAERLLASVDSVQIVACGTSFHAGLVAKYWIEDLAGIPCNIEIASEFRYRKVVVPKNALFVTISQSGETADTLAALRMAKELGYAASLCVCNVPESSLVRESDVSLMTRAGPEIGVASTKAFTTQLTALLMFAVALAKTRGLEEAQERAIVEQLQRVPELINQVLELDPQIEKMAENFIDLNHALFLGRGVQYPVAMEGALKLKEISYIHAEAYAAGELKHGPLALVDENMPVVAVAPNNALLEKLNSNLQEVRARGGQLYLFAHANGKSKEEGIEQIEMPDMGEYIEPIVYTVPLQLLSYHVAVMKGTDVDQPRNLAKSVTVE